VGSSLLAEQTDVRLRGQRRVAYLDGERLRELDVHRAEASAERRHAATARELERQAGLIQSRTAQNDAEADLVRRSPSGSISPICRRQSKASDCAKNLGVRALATHSGSGRARCDAVSFSDARDARGPTLTSRVTAVTRRRPSALLNGASAIASPVAIPRGNRHEPRPAAASAETGRCPAARAGFFGVALERAGHVDHATLSVAAAWAGCSAAVPARRRARSRTSRAPRRGRAAPSPSRRGTRSRRPRSRSRPQAISSRTGKRRSSSTCRISAPDRTGRAEHRNAKALARHQRSAVAARAGPSARVPTSVLTGTDAEVARAKPLSSTHLDGAGARLRGDVHAPDAQCSEQHRDGEDRRERVRLVLPGDVGCAPWIGSKSPLPSSPRLADGSMPSDPVIIAASSERMSPNMFGQSSTSNFGASRSRIIAAESTSWCSSFTSGTRSRSPRRSRSRTRRPRARWPCGCSWTSFLRPRAARNATRAMRATSCSS